MTQLGMQATNVNFGREYWERKANEAWRDLGYPNPNPENPSQNDLDYDAFRHAYTSAQWARGAGEDAARLGGDHIELTNRRNFSSEKGQRDMRGDLINNEKGREIGKNAPGSWDDRRLAEEIDGARKRGELVTDKQIDPRTRTENFPEALKPKDWRDYTGDVIDQYLKEIEKNVLDSLIDLSKALRDAKRKYDEARRTSSPLTLDLNGDGVQTLDHESGAYFDHDGDGFAEQTGWASREDGLLARDLDGNGQIDTGRELFGNHTQLANGQNAGNGFEALTELDSNHDGKIDAADSAYATLQVWQDSNGDGLSSADELHTLNDAGVQSIATGYTTAPTTDAQGNEHRQIGTFTTTTGETRAAEDIWFQVDKTYSIATEWLDVPVDIAALPDLAGYGNVYDLHQAMVRDTTGELKTLVERFGAEATQSGREQLFEQILNKWTGGDAYAANNRGTNIAGRKVYAVEAFMGEPFVQYANTEYSTPNPGPDAAAKLAVVYADLYETNFGNLMAQTHLKGLCDGIVYTYDEASQSIKGDLSGVAATLSDLYQQDHAQGMQVLEEFVRSIKGIGVADTMGVEALISVGPEAGDIVDSVLYDQYGTTGEDLLWGSGWDDSFRGRVGDDVLVGGEGDDTYDFKAGDGHDRIIEEAGASGGLDTIRFGQGIFADQTTVGGRMVNAADGINFDRPELIIQYNNGADSVAIGDFENVWLQGGRPIEQVTFADGAVWDAESLLSRVGMTTNGDDMLFGQSGDDSLDGQAGNDYIAGKTGNDTLIAGQGDDWLNGGDGDDAYVYNRGDGRDVILEKSGNDMLQFGADISATDVRVSRTARDLNFNLDATGERVTVQNYFTQGGARIEQATFADTTTWSETDWLEKARESTTGNDYLDGADTSETLAGLAGDDEIFGNGGDDTLVGGAGNDVLAGGSGNDTYLFGRGSGLDIVYEHDVTLGNLDRVLLATDIQTADIHVSREGDDLTLAIKGTMDKLILQNWVEQDANHVEQVVFADNTIWDAATLMSKAMDGSEDHDTKMGFRTDDTMHGNGGNDTIHGLDGSDTLFGDDGFDTLYGGAGNDVLDGGAGDDTLRGGYGDDTYLYGWGDGKDRVFINDVTAGKDRVQLRAGVELDDIAISRSASSLVLQRKGSGAMAQDMLILDDFFKNDPVSRFDAIRAADNPGVVWDAAYIKNKVIQATDSSDTILGYASADVLEGKGGNDYIDGYEGDDRISGDQNSDTLKGGYGNDTLLGGDGSDTLDGGAGADTLDGGTGKDTLTGGAGNDVYLFGRGDGHDTILNGGETAEEVDAIRLKEGIQADAVSLYQHGNDLAVVLDGGSTQIWAKNAFDTSGKQRIDQLQLSNGTVWSSDEMAAHMQTGVADVKTGTTGDDLFLVDHTGDTISEGAGQGTDTVQSWVEFSLGNHLENLTLTGALNINGTGNSLNNVIQGNSGNNLLDGGGMTFGWNNDGTDTLIGGAGDDTYYVTPSLGDEVIELAGEGNDTVIANFGYTLADNVENLTIQSNSNNILTATGNELDNVITGRSNVSAYIDQYGSFVGDTIDGGAGADIMTLALGGTFYVDNVGDQVRGAAGNHRVFSSVDFTLGEYARGVYPAISDLTLLMDAGDINATGNGGSNTLKDNNGNNILVGGAGNDKLIAIGGNDTLIGGTGNDTYSIGGGDSGGMDVIDNTASDGDTAVDTLEIGGGVMLLREGDDLLVATGETSGVTVKNHFAADGSGRIDQIKLSGGTVWDAAQIEQNLTVVAQGTSGADSLVGTWFGDAIHGGDEADTISGISGADHLFGDAGNDTLYGGTGADVLEGGEGDDWLNDEDGEDTLIGGIGNDYLAGNYGNDLYLFARGDGVDVISDYDDVAGNQDTVRFDDSVASGDIKVTRDWASLYLSVAGTTDRIQLESWLTDEAKKIERVEFANGTSWNGDDLLARLSIAEATEGDDALFGASGDNVIHGLGGYDTLLGQDGNDALYGDADDDILYGEGGNDWLDGGSGADTLEGGAGDDTYVVDDTGDVITENLNQGVDTVQSAITLTLGANLENLVLTGSAAINGTGNSLNNVITGNSAANILKGGTGNDTYYVGTGDTVTELSSQGADTVVSEVTFTLGSNLENLTLTGAAAINGTGNTLANTLVGNSANNTLSGGTGADTLIGGAGNDTYVVDNILDVVTENINEGTDLVQSGVTYTLAANVENLTLTGTSAINGTGNALDNVLTGNSAINTLTGGAGNDRLDGKAGADKMLGGTGDDTYVVDISTDVITENANEGIDSVESSVTLTLGANVENLTLTGTTAINGTGNTLNNMLKGSSAVNSLTGAAGNDTLDGLGGADTLTGGTGNDTYIMGRGYGADTAVENDATSGNTDIAQFLSGVSAKQIWFKKATNNLEVSIIGTGDKLVVKDWYLGSAYRVEQFKTTDGALTLLDSQVENLVNAMAAFAPPAAGETTLPPAYQTSLNTVIAANWQ